jgi:hypothetical protein
MRLLMAGSIVMLGLVGLCHADEKQGIVYVGTIGKSAIALRLEKNEQQTIGRYFYRSQGVDISLLPGKRGGEFIECPLSGGDAEPPACEHPTGYWTLSFGADAVTGEWRKTPQVAHALAIDLKRTTLPCDMGPADTSLSGHTYECLRSEGEQEVLPKKGTAANGAVTWQFVRDKRSGAIMPQLIKAPNAEAMRRINEARQKIFRNEVSVALQSLPQGESSCTPTVAFANERLFVIDENCESDWPGAVHPSSGWGTVSYDLATGDDIDWTTELRFPTTNDKTFDYAKGNDIVSLALRHAADKRDEDDCQAQALESFDCKGSVCTNWGHFGNGWKNDIQFSPRPQGLFTAFNMYPEMARNCRGEGFVLPWRDVRALQTSPRQFP